MRGTNEIKLKEYRNKRDFGVSSEPSGDSKESKDASSLIYVVQKHRATSLHYDFRLEWDGTLLSWAVPKGPSLNSSVKRLAMQVEDHPIDYATYEGVIAEGEYGGGTVMVWDNGTWVPEVDDVDGSLRKGELKFKLLGKKLKGSWILIRTRGFGSKSGRSWLLIKNHDEYASTKDITEKAPRSIVSKRLLAEIALDNGGNVEKAATGDPPGETKVAVRSKRKASPRRPTRVRS